ncbi:MULTISPECIES: hypothetical protein [unclassified Haladaptatus]|uniref:hypothetical protein n=1 Tax=unclassified Haladaptatus TaxID=2622732 RepID=UPI0023E7F18D|nr:MULTISPECIES: hypothetical protein [unclassified Haladaptatus]
MPDAKRGREKKGLQKEKQLLAVEAERELATVGEDQQLEDFEDNVEEINLEEITISELEPEESDA